MSIQATIKDQIIGIIRHLYDVRLDDVVIEIPPRLEFGDMALPIAFDLAKRLKEATGQKQNPRQLAQAIVAQLQQLEGIAKIEIAGPGYINIFLDRADFLLNLGRTEPTPPASEGKAIIEHTSVNPNKAVHIGHLRNAVLGDTLVRLLRSVGENVEVHNYIDNTGPQVADVVVGFKYLEGKSLQEIQQIDGKFDYECWDLYARVTEWYEREKSALEHRTRVLHEIEAGNNLTAEMAEYISIRVLNCQLDTLDRLGIRYDVLPRESDILHLRFWEHAFELLKRAGLVVFQPEGRNKGCWVMKAADKDRESSTEEQEQEYDVDKILVRSNGTVMYTGKDIAYHLWKLGKLGVEFHYKPFRTYPDRHMAWITTTETDSPDRPAFGNGSYYLSVIGSEQTYLQRFVKIAVQSLVGGPKVERSAHVGYEKVALSPAACLELGIELAPEELGRQQISMSGRRGLGVKADDLIDKLEERALAEVRSRHGDLAADAMSEVAHKIALGALRYFLLKYTRTSVITFDFKEALSFDGETGPYIQYAVVRANSIFRKLDEAGLSKEPIENVPCDRLAELLSGEAGDDLWSLIYFAARLDDTVGQACQSYEPALVAKHTFQLAQKFNLFYHHHRIISEPDPARRALLVAVTEVVAHQLTRALKLMGIEVPERM
jgi:arginyl-tRNA synthetase